MKHQKNKPTTKIEPSAIYGRFAEAHAIDPGLARLFANRYHAAVRDYDAHKWTPNETTGNMIARCNAGTAREDAEYWLERIVGDAQERDEKASA